MTEQEKEIATIKEREIKIKLSDADCERITELAGVHSMTVSEIIENFIGDLVSGTYSNGSDEREFAKKYFERCWFGMFPERTFTRYLLENYEMEEFLDDIEFKNDMIENIEITEKEIEDSNYNWFDICIYNRETGEHEKAYKIRKEWEEEQQEYIKEYKEDLENVNKSIKDTLQQFTEWNKGEQITEEEAIKQAEKWKEELKKLKGE